MTKPPGALGPALVVTVAGARWKSELEPELAWRRAARQAEPQVLEQQLAQAAQAARATVRFLELLGG